LGEVTIIVSCIWIKFCGDCIKLSKVTAFVTTIVFLTPPNGHY